MVDGRWIVVRPSRYARRITAATPMTVSGPAARDAALRTRDDASGRVVLGTINNCAHGFTPWGTYLACEENFNGYFVNASGEDPARAAPSTGSPRRASATAGTSSTSASTRRSIRTSRTASAGWSRSTPGIPPPRRSSAPRSAASSTRAPRSRSRPTTASSSTMGDDERFEYVYKFVSTGRYRPGDRAANRDLLDDGIAVRRALRRRRQRSLAAAGARPGTAHGGERIREPGRRA